MKGLLYQLRWTFVLGLMLALLSSCNEDYKNMLKEEYTEPELTKSNKKVLYIIMDGVNGKVLQNLHPTHITDMTEHALYSFDALLDIENYPTDNLLGWSDLLTGKKPSEHGAIGNGTAPDLDVNPTILSLAKHSSLIASSQEFYDTFGPEAVTASVESSDEAAYQKALTRVVGSSDDDLIVVEFNSAETAAQTGGYSLSNTTYSEAIVTIDGYIGGLKDAITTRDTYNSEDWLVVVTSNKGGENPAIPSNNHFLNPAKNIFAMYYSPRVGQREYVAPEDFNFIADGLSFTYPATNPSLLTLNSNKFSADVSAVGKGTTYQFKVKMSGNDKPSGSSWATLLSKSVTTGSTSGNTIDIFTSTGSGAIQVKTKGGNTVNIINPFANGQWHTVTIVYERTSSTQIRVRTYQDGNIGGTSTFNNADQLLGEAYPIRIGRNNTTVNAAPVAVFYDLKIYDVGLPENYIMNNYCKTVAEETSPYNGNLKGYWLLGNVQGNQIPNLKNPNDNEEKFTMTNASSVTINEFVEVFCPPFVDESFKVVPLALDNSFMTGSWLNIDKAALRKMDGRAWAFLYETSED